MMISWNMNRINFQFMSHAERCYKIYETLVPLTKKPTKLANKIPKMLMNFQQQAPWVQQQQLTLLVFIIWSWTAPLGTFTYVDKHQHISSFFFFSLNYSCQWLRVQCHQQNNKIPFHLPSKSSNYNFNSSNECSVLNWNCWSSVLSGDEISKNAQMIVNDDYYSHFDTPISIQTPIL